MVYERGGDGEGGGGCYACANCLLCPQRHRMNNQKQWRSRPIGNYQNTDCGRDWCNAMTAAAWPYISLTADLSILTDTHRHTHTHTHLHTHTPTHTHIQHAYIPTGKQILWWSAWLSKAAGAGDACVCIEFQQISWMFLRWRLAEANEWSSFTDDVIIIIIIWKLIPTNGRSRVDSHQTNRPRSWPLLPGVEMRIRCFAYRLLLFCRIFCLPTHTCMHVVRMQNDDTWLNRES